MTQPSVPYVPGPSSAPVSPPVTMQPAAHPPAAAPVVGATIDLAHEIGALRKLHTATMAIAGLALLCALFAAVFSGFVAYELWTFLGALHRAFG